MPSVSVIIPVFNGVQYLPQFLKSLEAALPENSEVIFIDDDSTKPVLERIPEKISGRHTKKLRNPYNQGYSATVNRGFSTAKNEILVQLNTDLILDPDCIKKMIELIDTKPNVGIVGSKQILPTTGKIRHIGMAFGLYRHRHIYSGLPKDHPLCSKTRKMQIVSGATVAMNRKVLEKIGPLDERYYNTLENFAHCMAAKKHGYTNYTCAESITYHWVSQSGPARFARVKEGEAIFWSDWTSSRKIDLGAFADEAIENLLNNNSNLERFHFEPLNLCRGSDAIILLDCLERRWPGIGGIACRSKVFNSPNVKLWLPMELPFRAILNPSPYIYLVDRFEQLSENHFWFKRRAEIVSNEIILDTRAVAVTTKEFFS